MKDIKKDPFEEYIKNLPPTRRELGEAWSAAIGLQDVDGLKPSEYLYETAKKNINGEITIDEVDKLINSYYETKEGRAEHGTEEADKVSARIARLLSDKAFVFFSDTIHQHSQRAIYGNLFPCRKNQRLQYHKKRVGAGWRYGCPRQCFESEGNS